MNYRKEEKSIKKLFHYIKKNNVDKFQKFITENDFDLSKITYSKVKCFFHVASKYAESSFIRCLLTQGLLPVHKDKKGDLPIHVAIRRALSLPSDKATHVYCGVIIPLLEAYPGCAHIPDRYGSMLDELLSTLSDHIALADETDRDNMEGLCDTYFGQSESWNEKLAREFETENSECFDRYSNLNDYDEENSPMESYDAWADRMWQQMYSKRHHQHPPVHRTDHSAGKRKHSPDKHAKGNRSRRRPSVPPGDSVREALVDREKTVTTERLRRYETFEKRFQKILKSGNRKKLSYAEIPWPSFGSMEDVMSVLLGKQFSWTHVELKKYIRTQQVRWHPDKFRQKFVDKIAPESLDRVMRRVNEISQVLNAKCESLSEA